MIVGSIEDEIWSACTLLDGLKHLTTKEALASLITTKYFCTFFDDYNPNNYATLELKF